MMRIIASSRCCLLTGMVLLVFFVLVLVQTSAADELPAAARTNLRVATWVVVAAGLNSAVVTAVPSSLILGAPLKRLLLGVRGGNVRRIPLHLVVELPPDGHPLVRGVVA